MGSKLSVLATLQLIAFAMAGQAEADSKDLARQLFQLGIEEYKTKQYDAAAASMSKSYALDPQPNALYALAQSERLANNCKDAITHYQKLLGEISDDGTVKAVKANIELCQQIEAGKEPIVDPKADPKVTEAQDAPILQIKTVYRTRTEQRSDKLAIAMYATGGTALGGSVVLWLVARSTRSDADRAMTLDEYNDRFDRAERLRWMSYGAAGLGAVLVTYATIRVIRGGGASTESTTPVAVVPVEGGSMVSWSGRW